MKSNKTLSQYSIHHIESDESRDRNFYRIKVIEKQQIKKSKVSLGINSNFYKINSIRKIDWEKQAPWYREAQDGLNWIGYCKNIG